MPTQDDPTRYRRVQEILNEAQGRTVPEYDGKHAFWMLPLDEFLAVEIYGQRMIAPADDRGGEPGGEPAGCGCGHCAGSGDTQYCWPTGGTSGPSRGTTRSARSALIAGLRGQPPFDGTTFPRLLWHAARSVTDAEISLIADWIDAGCPATDEPAGDGTVAVRPEQSLRRAHGDEPHPQSDRHLSDDRDDVEGLRVRKDVAAMTDDELAPLRDAIACMHTFDPYWLDERSYNHWARLHTNSCQHGWEQFLPWHRLYLYFFEQMLQDYDPRITLPYWSWSEYAAQNQKADETTDLDLGVVPEAYRCWIDESAAARLVAKTGADGEPLFTKRQQGKLRKLGSSQERHNSGLRFLTAAGVPYEYDATVKEGKAAGWSEQVKAVYHELECLNPLWIPQRWPGAIGHAVHYPTPGTITTILGTTPFGPFGSGPENNHYYGALEAVHNGMHNFAGGANPYFADPSDPQEPENPQYGYMVDNRVAAFDPIFFAHHSNVDRLWAEWQAQNPGDNPLDMDGVLPPWSLAVRDTLSITDLGYEYQKDAHHFPADPTVGIKRFASAPADVKPHVLANHRKADVRIHRVQRGDKENVTIRVFLNKPDADASTKSTDKHFAGQVTTFHGSCYGGPGHCAVPPPRSRKHDLRSLHHHEPRNFHLDVTETVAALRDEGADDFSVHLVVIGIDGKPRDSALFIDGVSLNFFD